MIYKINHLTKYILLLQNVNALSLMSKAYLKKKPKIQKLKYVSLTECI